MGFLDDYEPVENRIRAFWEEHPDGRIITTVENAPDGEYVFSAGVYRASNEGIAATGWAHESVAQLPANMKASALEVCETSAIGRALANLGYAPKGKRPSREEMSKSSGAEGLGMGSSAPGTKSEEGSVRGKGAPSSDSTSPAPLAGTKAGGGELHKPGVVGAPSGPSAPAAMDIHPTPAAGGPAYGPTCNHPLEQQYEATSGRIKCRICRGFVD